ncbi:serine dehydratase-like isoform X2 [Fundulus heteroclitus]|uniref:serine dehydratase-like isoform X2 n=1 Tax=Fundulus heteroclitus TaxID=8078 RepID=UPI00165AA87B|nr:serine dehydratase-like isoform X2 [Fundulus heteroclitus]
MAERFHLNTPLLESVSMSQKVGTTVYLKMENSQPSGSFKIRGIGHLCQQVWDEANAEALRLAETEGLTFVPPFDHPLLWEGHASLVAEAAASLGPGGKPGAVLLSVGGGGLLCGVIQGLKDAGWTDVPVIAMETVGADCLNAAIKAGKVVTLHDITSEAKCLGAKTVCQRAFEHSQSGEPTIISELVTDQEALQAVLTFLDEERVLVEMACGAALAAVYSGLIARLQSQGRLPAPLRPLLVVVCGGSSINMEQLSILRQKLQA